MPDSAASQESMTLNLQEFDPSGQSMASEEIPEQAQEVSEDESAPEPILAEENSATEDTPTTDTTESLEEQTRKLFEKIANADTTGKGEIAPPEESAKNTKPVSKEELEALTKKLFEKIVNAKEKPVEPIKQKTIIKPNPAEMMAQMQKAQLALKALKSLEQARLAKAESFKAQLEKKQRIEENLKKEALIKAEKEEQERLAKLAALQEQERLSKEQQEKERLAKEAEKKAEVARLAKLEEEKREAEQKKSEQDKIEKEERTQEEARKKQEAEERAKAQKAAQDAKLAKIEQAKQKKAQKRAKAQAIKEARRKARLAKLEKIKKQKALRKQKRLEKKRAKAARLAKIKKAKVWGEERKKRASQDALAKSLLDTAKKRPKRAASRTHVSSSTRRMISRFYGNEFNGFTGTQKAFIERNLGNIYVITQRVLSRRGYPDVALRTHQSGEQLVTFYLHPNGRISGLRLKKRIGYASLDKNTLQVVRIAHGKYPHPKSTTKITFYVKYELD